MKEGQMKINEEQQIVGAVASDQERVLTIPAFMDKSPKPNPRKKEVHPQPKLNYIKVNKDEQNNWELLKQLDEMIGLVLAGNEPKKGEIRYYLTSKDSYRSERIKGIIRVNK